MKRIDLQTFDEAAGFFGRTELLLAVKSFDLAAIRKRYLASRKRSRAGSVERRAPAVGGLVHLEVENGQIRGQRILANITEARGVDFRQPYLAVSSENRIFVFSGETQPLEITHPWLSYIHTVRISPDRKKCLVSSSGLDSILEFEIESGAGACTWHWLSWEHGLREGENPQTGEKFILTRDEHEAGRLAQAGQNVRLVQKPQEEHLPTAQRAAFINSAEYGSRGEIIATLFHRGEVISIDRKTGTFDIVMDGLTRPHGGQEFQGGILVTNTAGGDVRWRRDPELHGFDFTSLPGKAEAVKDLEWLQTSHAKDSRVVTIDSNRTALVFFDVKARKRCLVPFDPNWAVQDFIFLDDGANAMLTQLSQWFENLPLAEDDTEKD